ncbi:hypothetical protein CDAR_482821 [Caerostris darwini]|uniref:Uncharacterized protein n=1 Tax=Caerostris darwini TaxID=1538125 RepID=A0AAV4UYA0_9ARAC|nr:hypothetical protein CDAR_482821 [Caerostris darwini]
MFQTKQNGMNNFWNPQRILLTARGSWTTLKIPFVKGCQWTTLTNWLASLWMLAYRRGRSSSDHLQEPSSGAAEAMITDSPILTEAEHCSHITAAQTQLKDREKLSI